eukprot:GHVN01073954.1.p1 GENE.GHVN01073954.1~~GHVN01073954.1.p1  ORF type:complete len:492 (+),score=58.06 GHVN01073954.1:168-1643(+)
MENVTEEGEYVWEEEEINDEGEEGWDEGTTDDVDEPYREYEEEGGVKRPTENHQDFKGYLRADAVQESFDGGRSANRLTDGSTESAQDTASVEGLAEGSIGEVAEGSTSSEEVRQNRRSLEKTASKDGGSTGMSLPRIPPLKKTLPKTGASPKLQGALPKGKNNSKNLSNGKQGSAPRQQAENVEGLRGLKSKAASKEQKNATDHTHGTSRQPSLSIQNNFRSLKTNVSMREKLSTKPTRFNEAADSPRLSLKTAKTSENLLKLPGSRIQARLDSRALQPRIPTKYKMQFDYEKAAGCTLYPAGQMPRINAVCMPLNDIIGGPKVDTDFLFPIAARERRERSPERNPRMAPMSRTVSHGRIPNSGMIKGFGTDRGLLAGEEPMLPGRVGIRISSLGVGPYSIPEDVTADLYMLDAIQSRADTREGGARRLRTFRRETDEYILQVNDNPTSLASRKNQVRRWSAGSEGGPPPDMGIKASKTGVEATLRKFIG